MTLSFSSLGFRYIMTLQLLAKPSRRGRRHLLGCFKPGLSQTLSNGKFTGSMAIKLYETKAGSRVERNLFSQLTTNLNRTCPLGIQCGKNNPGLCSVYHRMIHCQGVGILKRASPAACRHCPHGSVGVEGMSGSFYPSQAVSKSFWVSGSDFQAPTKRL